MARPVPNERTGILRRLSPISAVVLACLLLASTASATRPNTSIDSCAGHHVTAKSFAIWSASVWDTDRWRRGKPPAAIVSLQREKLRCARGPGHRRAIKDRWAKDRRSFLDHRRRQLWRIRVTPFPGPGNTWWAVPYSIVVCESGARSYVPSGYYGILFTSEVPTWQTWGDPGFAPTPGQASKREQDIVAHRLYVAYGLQPWECAGIVGLPEAT